MSTRLLTEEEKKKLEKLKISTERFDNEYDALTTAGFTDRQATALIIKRSSSNTVKTVLKNHSILLGKPYALSLEQVFRIAANDGGSKNIEAVKAAFEELKTLGFNPEQIVRIAANDGGSRNIEAVKSAFDELKALDFSAEQVVSMVSYGGGSKNIDAVKAAFDELKALKLNTEQIVRIAANDGGSKNIEAVKSAFDELKALKFNTEQIVCIAARHGGSKNIEAVKAAFDELKALGFNPEQIIRIAAHNGGSKNIEAVKAHTPALKAYGFTSEAIVKLVGRNNGSGVIRDTLRTSNQTELDLGACLSELFPPQEPAQKEDIEQLQEDLFPLDTYDDKAGSVETQAPLLKEDAHAISGEALTASAKADTSNAEFSHTFFKRKRGAKAASADTAEAPDIARRRL